jgi:prolyl oligopeptidase
MSLRIWQIRVCLVTLFSLYPLSMTTAQETAAAAPVNSDDPYAWLEDVTGEKALDWVRKRNLVSQTKLEANPGFEKLREDLLAIMDSNARIPMASKRGDFYYNFWRDKENPRGLWRRTTLDEYRKAEPKWEVILDLDSLSTKENENWVWRSADLLRPDFNRCLITLSRGGADANVTREFDMTTREFVADGFSRPESKGGMGWIDLDHCYVYTDFGPGSMTTSGYPRIAKLWKRGTPISEAKVIYEGQDTDMSIAAIHDDSPGYERSFVSRTLAFYNDELYYVQKDNSLVKLDIPNSVEKSVAHQYLACQLRDPWEVGGKTYAAGSLLVMLFDDFLAGKRNFEVLFQPTDKSALASFSFTKDNLILNVLEDVKNRIYVCTAGAKGWTREPLKGAPEFGSVSVSPVDSDESNAYWMTSTDYLTPTTLYYGELGGNPEKLKQLPAFFDSEGLTITQKFATSKDGTRVPYFMVSRKDMKLDGNSPTLLYGYGGFEISLTPGYNASVGRAWLTQGGVYVVANIRGGGEYGPRWHKAALRENRLRAYEDFAAVAEDLFKSKVTSPSKLGIQGGSNGGLLMGNMLTLYPNMFKAVVCQVPLLDMKRYNHLLAGASWMAEYGDPDKTEDWAFIQKFSPYQNVKSGEKYPSILFTTSTRDDRVHPGHARKMMARMMEQGHDVLYYENIEGGHGGAANNKQAAYMQALAYTFLHDQLFD